MDAQLEEGAVVNGTVKAAGTAEPIEGLQVCTAINENMVGKCVQTGVGGKYSFAGLTPGEYKIVFTNNTTCGPEGCAHLNYVRQFYKRAKASFQEATPISLAAGDVKNGIDAAMQKGASISGTVTNTAKTPLQGIMVCVSENNGSFGDCRSTDASGQYSVVGLPTGEYRISFTPGEGSYYVPQYYNGKSRFNEANLLAVNAGEAKAGVSAELKEGGAVTGTVTDPGENPIVNLQVCAREVEGPEFGESVDCKPTDLAGHYRFMLEPGSYKIQFTNNSCGFEGCKLVNYVQQYYDGKSRFGEADPVGVTAGATTGGIDAQMEEGASVSGTVTNMSGTPIQHIQVCAQKATGEFEGTGCTQTDADGEYTLAGLAAGEYTINFSGNSCGFEGCFQLNYVRQFFNGKSHFNEADPIDLAAGEAKTGVDAELEEGAEISGTVTDTSESPIEGIQVCAQPALEEEGEFEGGGGGCSQTNEAGEYAIVGIAPGEYVVQFSGNSCGFEGCFQLNYVSQYYNGKSRFDEADILSLNAGDVKTGIDAEMEEGAEISGTVTRYRWGPDSSDSGLRQRSRRLRRRKRRRHGLHADG